MKIDAALVAIVVGVAIIALVAGIGIGSNFQTLFSSDGFSQPLSQPRISLTEVRIGGFDDSNQDIFGARPPCIDIVGEILRNANDRDATANFIIVNSGNTDGFVVVELVIRGEVLSSNRYFIRGDDSVPKSLHADGINCAIGWEEVSVRIADISRS